MFKDFNIAQIGHPILRNKTKDIPINEIKSQNTQKIIEKMIKPSLIKANPIALKGFLQFVFGLDLPLFLNHLTVDHEDLLTTF